MATVPPPKPPAPAVPPLLLVLELVPVLGLTAGLVAVVVAVVAATAGTAAAGEGTVGPTAAATGAAAADAGLATMGATMTLAPKSEQKRERKKITPGKWLTKGRVRSRCCCGRAGCGFGHCCCCRRRWSRLARLRGRFGTNCHGNSCFGRSGAAKECLQRTLNRVGDDADDLVELRVPLPDGQVVQHGLDRIPQRIGQDIGDTGQLWVPLDQYRDGGRERRTPCGQRGDEEDKLHRCCDGREFRRDFAGILDGSFDDSFHIFNQTQAVSLRLKGCRHISGFQTLKRSDL